MTPANNNDAVCEITGTVPEMDDAQLRFLIAQAAGILHGRNGSRHLSQVFSNIQTALDPTSFPAPRLQAKEIIEYVAWLYRLSVTDLIGRRCSRDIARPRQIAMYVVKELCPHVSYPMLGMMLGGRDHTTCMYGVKAITRLRIWDDEIERDVKGILARFREIQKSRSASNIDLQITAANRHLEALQLEKVKAEARAQ